MEAGKSIKWKMFLSITYMLFVLGTSVIPMDRKVTGFYFLINLKPTVQNLLHIPVFAILSVLYLQILTNYRPVDLKKALLALIYSGGFGVLNEIIQIFIPGRYAGLTDISLNFFGSMLGILVFLFVANSRPGIIKRIVCG